MAAALYGPGGFYARGESPGAHFRTSVRASGLFAGAVRELLYRVDAALGHPDPLDVVDVGAGRGELLAALAADPADPAGPADPTGPADPAGRQLAGRLRLSAVERAPRPDGLPPAVRWAAEVAELPQLTGLLLANEWLDNVPVDVVEQTTAGPRLVLVTPAGVESLGPPPDDADLDWLRRWWPPLRPGERAEVGRPRDEAWAAAVGRLRRGVAVAADYGHRRDARPRHGTLVGYRAGRLVPPVPDAGCDLTAHVALDACAAAGTAAGAGGTLLTTQRDALRQLGVRAGRPPVALASTRPAGYLRALSAAGEAAELTDPAGLGGFGWLVQAVGVPVPLA